MKVKSILNVEPNAFKNFTKTTFQDDQNRVIYTFSKVSEGDEVDWPITADKQGNLKTARPKPTQYQQSYGGVNGSGFTKVADSMPKPREFKADPLKQASIEKQVALKSAIDLVGHNVSIMEPMTIKDQAYWALVIANQFGNWLTNGTMPQEPGEPAHTDADVPDDIDLENVEFTDDPQ